MKPMLNRNQWTVSNFNFKTNTIYYWRVDDNAITSNIYDGSGNVIGSNTTLYKGQIWKFTSHDGRAYNPNPYNGRVGLNEPLALKWTPGDFTLNQIVFVGTDSATIYSATSSTAKAYRAPILPRTTSSYSLTGLGTGWYSTTLTPGTTYWWKVTEVNGTTQWGSTGLSGVTAPILWTFTPAAYINIDDFEDYNSTADMNWLNGSVLCTDPILGTYTVYPTGTMTLALDALGKHGALYYNPQPYTEVSRTYSGGSIFTGNANVLSTQPKALRVDYIGAASNATDPTYNVLYVALEDTAGHVGVYLGDPAAQLATAWTQWYIPLTDPNFSGVNEGAISAFHLGFGGAGRCLPSSPLGPGNDGNVMFDNIRLYASTCNPNVTLAADMDGDCDVDINDLDLLANDWLWTAVPQHSITTTVPHKAPVIWYKFNEISGNTAADSASGYTADVCQTGNVLWEPTGGRNGAGCINLNTLASQNSHVEVRDPNTAFGFMTDANHYYNTGNGGSISLSVWINADTTVGNTMSSSWESFFTVYDSSWNERTSFSIPWRWGDQTFWFQSQSGNTITGPLMPVNYFGGRWNHWAAIKNADSNTMLVYCNGSLVGTATGANTPLFTLPVQSIRIGMQASSMLTGASGPARCRTLRFMTTLWMQMK